MKFIIKDEIKEVENAKQIYTAACAFDQHTSLVAKSNINTLLASEEGIAAAFGAGVVKGMVSDTGTSSHSSLSGLMQLLMKL
ncbi:hypothetical protein [Pseudocolwellia agarivorans]|uniref:hypothetical protein n=1 Tax=Pseudocolwellia agarivorans TaxID=1911682 RepID=UPI000984E7D7|nr:hypothetical protein [Pseudocolwellia agarivorans]